MMSTTNNISSIWNKRYAGKVFDPNDHSEILGHYNQEAEDGSPISIQIHRLKKPLMGLTHFKTLVGSDGQFSQHYEGAAVPGKIIDTPNGPGLGADNDHPLNNKVVRLFQGQNNESWNDIHRDIHTIVRTDALKWLLAHHRDTNA